MKFFLLIILTFSSVTSFAFFDSIAQDIPLHGEDSNDNATTHYSDDYVEICEGSSCDTGENETSLSVTSCKEKTDKSVPLKMINALRYSTKDQMRLKLDFNEAKGSYELSVNFPYMVTDCFKPSVKIKEAKGTYIIEVENVYKFKTENSTMNSYKQCLIEKGILKDGKLDRDKATFGTYNVAPKTISLDSFFDGREDVDHIEAVFASPKETPREFLTSRNHLANKQSDNCFNMEHFNGQRTDLLTRQQLADRRYEWVCSGNGNVLDVNNLLDTYPENAGNYNNIIYNLTQIKKALEEKERKEQAATLREQYLEKLQKVKKLNHKDEPYEYEIAVSEMMEKLQQLEEKDLKPLIDEYISVLSKIKKATGTEKTLLKKRLSEINNELKFYSRNLSVDFANKLAKEGMYDEAKYIYSLKVILDKKGLLTKQVKVKDDKGKTRKVLLDSYDDALEYAEYYFNEKSKSKYTELARVYRIKEEGAEYSEESYEKAKEIMKNANKRYEAFIKKLKKYCTRNMMGVMDDKDKCEKYYKQLPKEQARRSKGLEIAGKYLGDAKKYKELENEYSSDEEDDDLDMYDPEEFISANQSGSLARYGSTNYGPISSQFSVSSGNAINPYTGMTNMQSWLMGTGGGQYSSTSYYNPYSMYQSPFGTSYGQQGGYNPYMYQSPFGTSYGQQGGYNPYMYQSPFGTSYGQTGTMTTSPYSTFTFQ